MLTLIKCSIPETVGFKKSEMIHKNSFQQVLQAGKVLKISGGGGSRKRVAGSV